MLNFSLWFIQQSKSWIICIISNEQIYKTMKLIFAILISGLLALFSNPTTADLVESLDSLLTETGEKTKAYGDEVLRRSKEYYNTFQDPEVQKITKESAKKENSQHLKEVWTDVLENLDDALELNTRIDTAPEHTWIGADKQSLNKDQINVFSEIESLLANPGITAGNTHINQLRDLIERERESIASLREKMVMSSLDGKKELSAKIEKAKKKIADYNHTINIEKSNLQIRLQQMGLDLSEKQIDTLLSRVDSDDIIKMSVIYDVLADITRQLMELTQEFNEEIEQARKYYGMHVILLKFVMNMQQTYIDKMDHEYLPKIEKIQFDTVMLGKESRELLRKKQKAASVKLLNKNLQSQALTLKVAEIFSNQLKKQRSKVVEANKTLQRDYLVAKNTYDTVKLSAGLINLMRTNQASFSALADIQIPDILPFENAEMQRKFEELSVQLKN